MYPIVDIHCDLLSYLQESSERTPFDPLSKTSYAQMQEGGVALQTLAIFCTSKPDTGKIGRAQIELFSRLLEQYSSYYELFDGSLHPSDKIRLLPAFENAYTLCDESEPLEKGFDFLEECLSRFGRILYVSLTWDGENRFGGGVGSSTGLKEDGKRLVEFLDKKQIAIDLSHASDPLAEDLLCYIDKKSLKVPVIASHSNFRNITDRPRNLPDEIAQEVIRRKGLIGLNFFAPFIGEHPETILDHITHALSLGGEESLCFGADFFSELDFSYIRKKYGIESGFFAEIDNASKYPCVLAWMEQRLGLPPSTLAKISHENFLNFLELFTV